MAQQTRGELIKAARTAAKLTQEKLADLVGVTASDISKAERGDIDLTDAVLKRIAKETGVTQTSLISAPMGGTKTAAAKAPAKTAATTRTSSAKTTTAKTSTAKTSTAKTSAPKTPANADVSMKVTSTEKKLIEYYRTATSDQKKAATRVLKGECNDMLTTLVSGSTANSAADGVADLVGNLLTGLLGGGK